MKLFNNIVCSLLLLLCVSCNQEEVGLDIEQRVRIQAGIQTKASGTNWHAADQIGVFMQASEELIENRLYVNRSEDGGVADFDSESPIYLPMSGTANLYAYYPYTGDAKLGAYNIDVRNQTNIPAIDLMTAQVMGVEPSEGVQTMNFSHRLSLVNIKLDADASFDQADIENSTAKIEGLHTQASYSISTSTITLDAESVESLALSRAINKKIEAIVVPQNCDDAEIIFTIGGKEFVATLPIDSFESGKQYSFLANFTGGENLTLTASVINDWVPSLDNDYILVNIDQQSDATLGEELSNIVLAAYDAQGEQVAASINAKPYVNNLYKIDASLNEINKIYFFAGLTDELGDVVGITEAELKAKTIESETPSEMKCFYQNTTTTADLQGSVVSIRPKVGLAKLSVDFKTAKVVDLESFELTGLVASSAIVEEGNHSSSTEMSYSTFDINDLENDLYIFEDSDASVMATIVVSIDGVKNRLFASLPQKIERNKHYSIEVYSEGAKLSADVKVLPWGDSIDIEVYPDDAEAKVNTEESVFPEGTKFTENTITVFADFEGMVKMVIDAEKDIDLEVETNEFTITRDESALVQNTFFLHFDKADIRKQETLTSINVKGKDSEIFTNSHITVRREAYRMDFSNFYGLSDGTELSYQDYMDGTLLNMKPKSIAVTEIATESNDEQFNWIRVDSNDDGSYNVEGAFKPNDLEAAGQKQVSTMTVTYEDGYQESYTFSRTRRSLPVVKVAEKYWMKYNVRGNPNSYEDQIQHSEDVGNLNEYLKTCSTEEYMYYMGAQYKGQNKTPLYPRLLADSLVTENNSGMLLEGYEDGNNWSDQGTAGKSFFAPPGFIVPNESEWKYIVGWGLDVGGRQGYTGDYTVYGPRMTITGSFRDVTVEEERVFVGSVANMFEKYGDPSGVVLMGFGHQWSNDGFAHNEAVYVVTENKNRCVVFSTHPLYRVKFGNKNGGNTKYVRCIKPDVAYIIE